MTPHKGQLWGRQSASAWDAELGGGVKHQHRFRPKATASSPGEPRRAKDTAGVPAKAVSCAVTPRVGGVCAAVGHGFLSETSHEPRERRGDRRRWGAPAGARDRTGTRVCARLACAPRGAPGPVALVCSQVSAPRPPLASLASQRCRSSLRSHPKGWLGHRPPVILPFTAGRTGPGEQPRWPLGPGRRAAQTLSGREEPTGVLGTRHPAPGRGAPWPGLTRCPGFSRPLQLGETL